MTNSPPTEAFIRDLARRPAPAPLRPALVALAVAGAILAGLALFFALFGLRPDPGAMARPVVAAKALLDKKGVSYVEHDATGKPDLREEMIAKSGRNTFPQIFIGSRHVGGCDDLHALDRTGKLDPLLSQ